MRLGKEGGSAAALLRNQLIFWSSHPQEGIFEYNSDRPLLHAFFSQCVMVACALQGRCIHPMCIRGRRR
jgi:hypothetical protein